MKVTIAKRGETVSVYVAKKDLEQNVVASELPELWGGWIELANGWRLLLPPQPEAVRLPLTIEAKRLGEAGGSAA